MVFSLIWGRNLKCKRDFTLGLDLERMKGFNLTFWASTNVKFVQHQLGYSPHSVTGLSAQPNHQMLLSIWADWVVYQNLNFWFFGNVAWNHTKNKYLQSFSKIFPFNPLTPQSFLFIVVSWRLTVFLRGVTTQLPNGKSTCFQNEVNYLTVTSLENVAWDNFRQMETKLFILQRKLHSVGFYSFSVVSPWRHGWCLF